MSDDLAKYQVILGLRDTRTAGAKQNDSLELAVMLDGDATAHGDDTPHMIVTNWLRRHWPNIMAAAEIEHHLAVAGSMLHKIEEHGGLKKLLEKV